MDFRDIPLISMGLHEWKLTNKLYTLITGPCFMIIYGATEKWQGFLKALRKESILQLIKI